MISVTCACGKSFAAQPHLAGKRVRCPGCGNPLAIPAADLPAAPEPPAAKPEEAAPAAPAAPGERRQIAVVCYCGRRFEVDDELAGKRAKCVACGSIILVPRSGESRTIGARPLEPAEPEPAPRATSAAPKAAVLDDDFWRRAMASGPATATRSPASTAAPVDDEPILAELVSEDLAELPLTPDLDAALAPWGSPPASDRRRSPWKAVLTIGAIAAVVLLVCGGGVGLVVQGVRLANSANRWQTHASPLDHYSVRVPGPVQPTMRTEMTPHGPVMVRLAVCDLQGQGAYFVGVSQIPASAASQDAEALLESACQGALASRPGAAAQSKRSIELHGHPGREMTFDTQVQGVPAVATLRLYVIKDRIYQLMWLGPKSKVPQRDIAAFFGSFELTGEMAPRVAARSAASASPYALARQAFRSKLTRQGAPPQAVEPLRTPPGARRIDYLSDGRRLAAFVDPPPTDGRRRPAVLFLHGGFGFGEGDWEMPQPFRDAGYVVMIPTLRGENGQPGEFSLFLHEVDDVLAAADALAALPYVDGDQIFVAGHSAGGTLAALAAMTSDRFRAAASLSGCMDQRLNADIAPFSARDDKEFAIRSPVDHAASLRTPARLYYGSSEGWAIASTNRTAQQARSAGADVQAETVPGDHFSSVPPAMRRAVAFFQQHTSGDLLASSPSASPSPAPSSSPAPSPARSLPTGPSFRPPPSFEPPTAGPPPIPGRRRPGQAVVVFELKGFSGRGSPEFAARRALLGLFWVDPTYVVVDQAQGELLIGVRQTALDTGNAKARLEAQGFQLGGVQYLPNGRE